MKKGLFSQSISLERQERELNKPKNWGEITFLRLQERYGNLEVTKSYDNTLNNTSNSNCNSNSHNNNNYNQSNNNNNNNNNNNKKLKPIGIKKKVQLALEENAVNKSPLDGSNILINLNEIEQCEFFINYPNCEVLILNNWKYISDRVLRSITITMGESLTELDVSNSNMAGNHFEILFGRVCNLKILKLSSCPLIDSHCMKLITQTSNRTLKELYVDHCSLFKVEPLLWMSGVVGINSSKLSKLRTLDLSYSPLEDSGLEAIAIGMKLIRYLNLEGCEFITDKSLTPVVKSNKKLYVLNISGCYLITSKSIIALSTSCLELVSLNMSRCGKVTDSGMNSLSQNCHKLQALNVAGLRLLSEGSIFSIAQNCPGILMLNVTGCDNVTINGLRSLIHGLKYVIEAKTYVGFKPIDEHIEKKLMNQLHMIRDRAAFKISHAYHSMIDHREHKSLMESIKIDKSARLIQNYMTRYMLRIRFYYKWRARVMLDCAILIQRVFRGYRGRILASHAAEEKLRLQRLTPWCIRLQKVFRGKRCRRQNKYIQDVIREFYERRRREAECGILVRLQAYGRHYLAQKKLLAWREMVERRREDAHNAAIVIQGLIRSGLSKGKMKKLLQKKQRIDDMKNRSAARIQAFYRASKGKYNSKLTRQELLMIQRRRKAAGDLIGRIIRGHQGRQKANKLRIEKVVRYVAARTIQRIYRGRRVIHWRDMRLNIIASFILDRQYIERMERTKMARYRYQQYLQDIQKDSASESDDEVDTSAILWVKNYNPQLNIQYWVHVETNEISYEEPPDETALQKSLIGTKVKILWCVQNEWFEGTVTRYHVRKKRFRIEYDDGDHEWLNIEQERDRVQVLNDVGSWVMFSLWKPPLIEHEIKKREQKLENQRIREEAYRDARQWRIITTDVTLNDENYNNYYNNNYNYDNSGSNDNGISKSIMYMSDLTGIIRTGAKDTLDWIIQDDGYGFPCFYNITTGETVYEDPRFELDVSEDIQEQRNYIMSELRYSLYFCKDILERYENSVYLKNQQKINYLLHKITQTNKPKLLSSFLLRAKNMYKQYSIVDKQVDESISKELEYASYVCERMNDICSKAEEYRQNTESKRKEIMKKVIKIEKNSLDYDPMNIKV